MLSNRNWMILFAVFLAALSFVLFSIHYLLFHDLHHILLYTIHDIAFLPVEVLLVTVVLHQMLERRSMRSKFEKLNMVIGLFFSETGTPLLHAFSARDSEREELSRLFISVQTWNHVMFVKQGKMIRKFRYHVQAGACDLVGIRDILVSKEDFLVRMLENPVLLEHEAFTDVLRAVFHLTEELKHRGDCTNLPESDMNHLTGDIRRAYSAMTASWLSYLEHLQSNYPYLFSLAIRTNPFLEKEDVIIRE